jgi:hypothetical protein
MTSHKIDPDRIFDLASDIFRQRLLNGIQYPEGDAKAFGTLFKDMLEEINPSPKKQKGVLTESSHTE